MSHYDYNSGEESRKNLIDSQHPNSEESELKFELNEVQFIPVELHDEKPCRKYSGSLSQRESERYYSHEELKTIQKFNSLFNKVVVLPSNTFCGRSLTSSSNKDYGNIRDRGKFGKTSDEELVQYGQNSKTDRNMRKPDHYSSEYHYVSEEKKSNKIKLIENFEENFQSQTVIFHKLQTGNYQENYNSLFRIIYQRNLVYCDNTDLGENNHSESSKLGIHNHGHHNPLGDSMTSTMKDYNETISMSNKKEINTSCTKSSHSKDPPKKKYYRKITRKLLEINSKTSHKKINNCRESENSDTLNLNENPCLMEDNLELKRAQRSQRISDMNYSKLNFESKFSRVPEQCQFFVKNMSIIGAGLSQSDELVKFSYSNENHLTSTMKDFHKTNRKSLVDSQLNEELSVEENENITMILNEKRIFTIKRLFRKKLLELPSCNCERNQCLTGKLEQPEHFGDISNEKGERVGTYNTSSKIINEEKRKEREEKIQQLVKEVTVHDRCIIRGESFERNIDFQKTSSINREPEPMEPSEEISIHPNIQNKIYREKKIHKLINTMCTKCHGTREIKTDKYKIKINCTIKNINEIKKPPEQYDKKKQREMRLEDLIVKMKIKKKCICEPCKKMIDDALSEYISTEICDSVTQSKSIMSPEISSNKTENLSLSHDELYILEKVVSSFSEEKKHEEEPSSIGDFTDIYPENENNKKNKLILPEEQKSAKKNISEELINEYWDVHKEHTIDADMNIDKGESSSTKNSAEKQINAKNIGDSEVGIGEGDIYEIKPAKENWDVDKQHSIEELKKAGFLSKIDEIEKLRFDDKIEDNMSIDKGKSSINQIFLERETENIDESKVQISLDINELKGSYESNTSTSSSIIQKEEPSVEFVHQEKSSTEKESLIDESPEITNDFPDKMEDVLYQGEKTIEDNQQNDSRPELLTNFQKSKKGDDGIKTKKNIGFDVDRPKILGQSFKNLRGSKEKIPKKYKLKKKFHHENEIQKKKILAAKDDKKKTAGKSITKRNVRDQKVESLPESIERGEYTDRTQPKYRKHFRSARTKQAPELNEKIKLTKNETHDSDTERKKLSAITPTGKKSSIMSRKKIGADQEITKTQDESKRRRKSPKQYSVNQENLPDKKLHEKRTQIRDEVKKTAKGPKQMVNIPKIHAKRTQVRDEVKKTTKEQKKLVSIPKIHEKRAHIRDELKKTTKEQKQLVSVPETQKRSIVYTKSKSKMMKEKKTKHVQDISDTESSEQKIILKTKHSKKRVDRSEERKGRGAYHSKTKIRMKKRVITSSDEEKLERIEKGEKLDEKKPIDSEKYPADETQTVSFSPRKSEEKDMSRDNDVVKIELNSEYLDILEDVALAKALEMEEILKISISPKNKTGISMKHRSKEKYIGRGTCGKCTQKPYGLKMLDSEQEWSPSSLINISIVLDDSNNPKCTCRKKISSRLIQNSNSLSNVLNRKSSNMSSKVKGNFFSACKKTCNKVTCSCNHPSNLYSTSSSGANDLNSSRNFPPRRELPSGNIVDFRNMPDQDSSNNFSSYNGNSISVCGNLNCSESSNMKPCENISKEISLSKMVEAHRSSLMKRKRFSGKDVRFQCIESDNSQKYNECRKYESFDFNKYTTLSANLDEEKSLSKCCRNPCFQQRLSHCNSGAENSSLKSCILMKSSTGDGSLQKCIYKNYSRIMKPQCNETKINFARSKGACFIGRFTEKSSGTVKMSQVRNDIIDIEKVITKNDSNCLDDKLCRKLGCHDLTGNCGRTLFTPTVTPMFYATTDKPMNISQEFIKQNEDNLSLNRNDPIKSLAEATILEINSVENVKTESQTVYCVSSNNTNTPRITKEERRTFKTETRSGNHDTAVYNFIEILTKCKQKFVSDENNRNVLNHAEKSEYSIWNNLDLSEYPYAKKINDDIVENTISSSDIEELSLSCREIESNRTMSVSNKKSNKISNKQRRKKKKEFLHNYEKQRSIIMRKKDKTNSKHQPGIYNSEKNMDKINKIQSESTTERSSLSFCSDEKLSNINKSKPVLCRSKHTAHKEKISMDEPPTMKKNEDSYSPYRTNPALYHVAVESVENENQINPPNQRIKFRIAFFFKKSKGKIINWFKYLQTNKKSSEVTETTKGEESDRALNARANLIKQKNVLNSKLRQIDSKTSKLYLHNRLYEDRSRVEITDSMQYNQPKPVLQEIKSCDIIVPALEDDLEEGNSEEDQMEEGKDQELFVPSEDSSMLFIRKEVYDRLQRYGKLRYTLYIGKKNELDHISIESIESVDDKIECNEQPFFATFDLGTKNVMVHVKKDAQEDEISEAIFKDEDYVACENSQVKLSLMRGAKYLQQLDPKQANIIDIDCTNKLNEIKICYKKVEHSKTCICEYPQMCKSIQLESSDLSSVIIEKIDKFLDAREVCEDCEECMDTSKICVDYQECTDEKCIAKKEDDDMRLISELHISGLSEPIEQPETSRKYSECSDGICSKKFIVDSLSNEDEVDVKTVQFVHLSHRYGFQEDIYPKTLRREQTSEYHKKRKQELCASKDLPQFDHSSQKSGFIQKNDRRKHVPSKSGSKILIRKKEKQKSPITKRRRFQKRSCNNDGKATLILTITHFESILEI